MTSVSAIVFVLSKYFDTDGPRCMEYCVNQGYSVAGIVRDDWTAALATINAGLATIVVVADAEHLDDTCTPRMEVVAQVPTTEGPRGRRTRILRRNGAR